MQGGRHARARIKYKVKCPNSFQTRYHGREDVLSETKRVKFD